MDLGNLKVGVNVDIQRTDGEFYRSSDRCHVGPFDLVVLLWTTSFRCHHSLSVTENIDNSNVYCNYGDVRSPFCSSCILS